MKVPTNFTCRLSAELHLILTFAVCISAQVFNTVVDTISAAVHPAGSLHLHLMHLPHHGTKRTNNFPFLLVSSKELFLYI